MRTVLALATLVMLLGCIPRLMSGPKGEYERAAALVKEKQYRTASELYRKIADESPQSPEAGDALYQAAYLKVFSGNPRRDYAKALQAFGEFLKKFPEHPRAVDARNWQSVLKLLLETKNENEKLNQNIEELKELDIRHEQRREVK